MASLQACQPCDCTTYGSRTVYNITSDAIQQWIPQANTAGKNHGMCPATFLAIASIETNGNASASGGGIVQVGQTMLTMYNNLKGTSYTLNDLNATGSHITTTSAAVALCFDILGQYMQYMETGTGDDFAKIATGWNGAMCGYSGSVKCFGSSNNGSRIGNFDIDVNKYHIDMLSLSAHKFYGPKGIGALYIKNGTNIDSIMHGGTRVR